MLVLLHSKLGILTSVNSFLLRERMNQFLGLEIICIINPAAPCESPSFRTAHGAFLCPRTVMPPKKDINTECNVRYCELMFDISNDFIIILLLLIERNNKFGTPIRRSRLSQMNVVSKLKQGPSPKNILLH